MNEFNITIPWDEDNREKERKWVAQVAQLMAESDQVHALSDFHSPVLERLRRDTAGFTLLGFAAESTEEGLVVRSTEQLEGDKDNATLYIKAFLDAHRKDLAVRLPWISVDSMGRRRRGITLVGPDGINILKLPTVRKAHR